MGKRGREGGRYRGMNEKTGGMEDDRGKGGEGGKQRMLEER